LIRTHITRNDGAGSNDGAVAYTHPRDDDRTRVDQYVVTDDDRSHVDDQRTCTTWFDSSALLRRYVNVRADVHVVADRQSPAAPEHAVGADLYVIADRDESVAIVDGARIQIGAVVDKDVVAGAYAVGAAYDNSRRKGDAP